MHQQNNWARWLPLATAVHYRAVNATTSDGKVRFSSVQWHILLNPELNFWFSSGPLPEPEPEPRVHVTDARGHDSKQTLYKVSLDL
jgi:hypothetical protein